MPAERWNPDPGQLIAAQWLVEHDRAGLFLKPGAGKTAITLATLTAKKERLPALIVAASRICYSVWPNEIRKWADFNHLSFTFLHPNWVGGSTKSGWQMIEALKEHHDIVCINHEGLLWLCEQIKDWPKLPWKTLVLDESSKFKHAKSNRSAIVQTLAPHFEYVYELTGSPAANSLEALFSQARILDNGAALGPYITHFRREFGWIEHKTSGKNPRGWDEWTPHPDAMERIVKRLRNLYLRVNFSFPMPDRTDNTVVVQLPEEAIGLYRQMERDYLIEVEGKTIYAPHGGAAQMKLRQIVSGFVYDEEGEPVLVHPGKMRALEKLLKVHKGEPVLIAVAFKHEAEAIQKLLLKMYGLTIPYMGGGIGPAASDKVIEIWNAGDLPALPIHPASAAHGLNLQFGGATVIWYSLTWDAEEYDQMNRRVWRRGQEEDVVIHHLITQGTVDERILETLQSRDLQQEKLLENLTRKTETKKGRQRQAAGPA